MRSSGFRMRAEVEAFRELALGQAQRLGLDAQGVEFREVGLPELHAIAAYGLPARFRHWTRGGIYQRLRLQEGLGLLRLYELVVHTRPPQAFLLRSNAIGEQIGVIAHVLGHVDFFRHSAHLRDIGGEMGEAALLHRRRIEGYRQRWGEEAVEEVLDRALMLENHVAPTGAEDLLGVIGQSAALLPWQRDCVAMVRREALYFQALRRTKIINEGWATFWHLRLMRLLPVGERAFLDFLRMHLDVAEMGPGAAQNPYALGLLLFERAARASGTPAAGVPEGEALEALRLMREVEDDLAFVRNHLTEAIAREIGLGAGDEGGAEQAIAALLRQIASGGRPLIRVAESGPSVLRLLHVHDGRDLDVGEAEAVLGEAAALLGTPVELLTAVQGERLRLRHDGRTIARSAL